jgi:hypothetical protein
MASTATVYAIRRKGSTALLASTVVKVHVLQDTVRARRRTGTLNV